MNNFPVYAEIPDRNKKDGKNFIVLRPDKVNSGFEMFFFEHLRAKSLPVDRDWSLELDDAYRAAELEYGIMKNDWRKFK
jgi:hypothetical protein